MLLVISKSTESKLSGFQTFTHSFLVCSRVCSASSSGCGFPALCGADGTVGSAAEDGEDVQTSTQSDTSLCNDRKQKSI